MRTLKLLSLGLTGTTDEVRARLQTDCRTLIQEGFRVAIDETNRGIYTFLGCNVIEGELSFRNYERIKNMLKNSVGQLLADLVVSKEEKQLVRKIVDHNYYYFNQDERNQIYQNSIQLLNANSSMMADFNESARRNRVLSKALEYLEAHHELVVDGFITFRLKDYRARLTGIVDQVVDEFMMDLEYKEFIRVLRYFVDVQESKMEEVHVVIHGNGTFKIVDGQNKPVNSQTLDHFISKSTEEINYEDLLISALISIAPRNVLLHCPKETKVEDVVDTIRSVFEGRVILCEGCDICHVAAIDKNTLK